MAGQQAICPDPGLGLAPGLQPPLLALSLLRPFPQSRSLCPLQTGWGQDTPSSSLPCERGMGLEAWSISVWDPKVLTCVQEVLI